jgi:hypothetical protein
LLVPFVHTKSRFLFLVALSTNSCLRNKLKIFRLIIQPLGMEVRQKVSFSVVF